MYPTCVSSKLCEFIFGSYESLGTTSQQQYQHSFYGFGPELGEAGGHETCDLQDQETGGSEKGATSRSFAAINDWLPSRHPPLHLDF